MPRLEVTRPFAAGALTHFWAMGCVEGVEAMVGATYHRSLRGPHGPGVVALTAHDDHVAVDWQGDPRDEGRALDWARGMAGADDDPAPADAALGAHPLLAPLVRATPGLRVHVDDDVFGVLVRSVLGQQVSVKGARTLTARMVAAVGEEIAREGPVTHAFPSPEAVARLTPEDFAMPRARGRALVGLARAVADGELDLDSPTLRADLLAQPGIGPWTVAHLALRALGDPDAFLPTDIGVRRAAERLGTDLPAVVAASPGWRPYRSLALTHLWLVATT
ncbi:hypothetical protein GCM10011519_11180 [Marmoricola endophyticus]|uniref:DNA-3-methyladenine glycosylase II n=1 Tax=Marmoricola endophyticus TaxID=2040280 RepID=A0A917BDW5_9ACTN|nr:DNA-3-methyladenine glycosylase 2 [Marmoricola endophyticus]GGF39290.1 hypothetical protein GCM10011519_11180 [Marmoricola endophyticus]